MSNYLINSWVRLCEEQLTDSIQGVDLQASATYEVVEKDGLKQMRVNIENSNGDEITHFFYAISDDGAVRKIFDAAGFEIGLELSDVVSRIKNSLV